MASERAKRTLAAYVRQGRTESLTYRPAGGTARTVNALVDRQSRDVQTGVATPRQTVTMLNDATLGALPPAAAGAGGVNRGGDEIDVAEWPGGTAVKRQIARVVPEETDVDWVVLEVR